MPEDAIHQSILLNFHVYFQDEPYQTSDLGRQQKQMCTPWEVNNAQIIETGEIQGNLHKFVIAEFLSCQ